MLTTTSEYAIRALGYLATKDRDTRVGSDEISEATKVPKRFLLKILNTLKNQGILKTSRGIGGGFSLAEDPENIRLYDIVSIFEDLNRHKHCLSGHEDCGPESPCPLYEKWHVILKSLEDFLETTTLQHFKDFEEKRGASLTR